MGLTWIQLEHLHGKKISRQSQIVQAHFVQLHEQLCWQEWSLQKREKSGDRDLQLCDDIFGREQVTLPWQQPLFAS